MEPADEPITDDITGADEGIESAAGSEKRDGYAHLFGDVYWGWTGETYVLALLGLLTLFVDYPTLVIAFGGVFDWLQATVPGTARRLEANYDQLWNVFFLMAIAFGFRFDPDGDT